MFVQMEPAVSSCLLSAYAALREVNQETAGTQIDKGFQYALAKWWQVRYSIVSISACVYLLLGCCFCLAAAGAT
jgi:hypothetical protein